MTIAARFAGIGGICRVPENHRMRSRLETNEIRPFERWKRHRLPP
jgi:hypothetical protein